MAIKPSGVPYELLDARRDRVVDLGAGESSTGSLRPSSDAPTHLVLYRCFADVGGVVHTHSPFATAWAQAGVATFPASARPTPTTSAAPFPSPVAQRARDRRRLRGAHRRRDRREQSPTSRTCRPSCPRPRAVHVGRGSEDAVENAVALEAVAALALRTLAIEPDAEELDARLRDRHFARKHGPSRYYGQS